MALLQLPKMTGKGALLQHLKKVFATSKHFWQWHCCSCPKKGISPTKDGAVPAVKDAGFLLLLMADKGAVAAVKKVFAPLKMVLLLLLR